MTGYSKFKKNVMSMVKPGSSLLNRSPSDLQAQQMVRQIRLLEVLDKRKKNFKSLKRN